jgi:hypothetical protein
MSKKVLIGACALVLVLAALGWRIKESLPATEVLFEGRNRPPSAAPLCPWREPENDLKVLFPEATRYGVETHILSGRRLELAEHLGRAPTGDENALHVYRIYQDQTPLGTVLTRRVKGAFGAIELVLGVGADEKVCGLRLQRLREPETIANALRNPEWLHSFYGNQAESSWKRGGDIPEVVPEARPSAEAVIDGVRCSLILLAAAERAGTNRITAPHH